MATYEGLVKLGTLRNGATIKPRPTLPWRITSEPYTGAGVGNIADFNTDPVITNWNIGDTDANDANKLQWHKIKDGAKTLLICDRVILVNVSWNDLHSDNRVFGKTITIDGQQYKLRLMTGGSNYRTGTDAYSGGAPAANEWDRFVTREEAITGLPSPASSDLDTTLNSTDKNSAHNQFWNWMGVYSWAQETYTGNSANRAFRGSFSARSWNIGGATPRYVNVGWRPVLEVLNSAPSVTLTTADNQTLVEGSTYTLAGTASDPDAGNAVTVKYSLNGGTARNITSAISDGASPIPFSKVLTFRDGRLYDGDTDVSGPLTENTTYTVSVWAVDDHGGTSPSYTRSFKVVLNRPPNIALDPYDANQTGLSVLETLVFTGTVMDPENDNVNLTASFNGGDPVTLKSGAPSGTTFEYKVPVSALVDGSNTVVFTATDSKGAPKTKTLTFNKSGAQAPVNTAVTRYSITPPLGSTAEIVAWVHREIGDLNVDAAFSIVGSDANETYAAMSKAASVPVGDGTVTEDEFVGTAAQPDAKVTLRLTLTRADASSDKAVKKIMGGIG